MVAHQPNHPKNPSVRHIIQQKVQNLAVAITATSTRRNVMRPHGVAKTVTFTFAIMVKMTASICTTLAMVQPATKCVFTHSKTRTSVQICLDKYVCFVYMFCVWASVLEIYCVLCSYVPRYQCLKYMCVVYVRTSIWYICIHAHVHTSSLLYTCELLLFMLICHAVCSSMCVQHTQVLCIHNSPVL